MDIYNEEDNVISSDEYDDNDDLLNVAVSSANLQRETQKSEVQPTPTATTYTKPQKKLIRKIGIKLKNKSVKWMQHKFKRSQIRNRYLYNIAQAKCINKTRSENNKAGSLDEHEKLQEMQLEQSKKATVTEENVRKEPNVKVTQHETIDLDDSDDDDDDDGEDDVDDYDEDDYSSNSSSNNEDEINNDEDDDLDEIKIDENNVTLKINNVVENDVHDNKFEQEKIENKIVDTEIKNVIKTDDLQKQEKNIPKNALEQLTVDPTVYNMPQIPHVANTTKSEQMSQIVDESLVIIQTNAPTIIPANSNNNLMDIDPPAESHLQFKTNKIETKDMSTITNFNDVEAMNITNDLGVEQSFFFNDELNAMYPNFDKIVNEHVTFPETAEIIKERIKLIAADVEHINKALEIKEKECNQLLYVKHTKEQILARLLRKIKRNEVNTENNSSAIEAIALRELGIVPKQTRTKEPPSKKRKLEPRTAQEIIEHGANMSMDEVLRAKAQNHLDANFIDETLKKFGLSNSKPIAKSKKSSNNIINTNSTHKDAFNTSINLSSVPEKRTYQQPDFNAASMDNQQAGTSLRGSNLLLKLLNADKDNDSGDDASISFNIKTDEHQSTLGHLIDNWSGQRHRQQQQQQLQQKIIRNSNQKFDDDDTYEVIIEEKAPTKVTNLFPILNQSKKNFNNSDETLVVHLDVSEFKDNNSTPKIPGDINNFICQHCGIHKAQYVCAECENQWYCSRSCQVKAWDSHCETCE